MILSDEKKFIFIHIYKVAGTSIRNVLMQYATPVREYVPFIDKVKFYLGTRFRSLSYWSPNHLKAKEIKSMLPESTFKNYFKFSFVRNPWDWQVSLYHFMLQDVTHPQHKLILGMKDFRTYIDWRVKKPEFQKEFLYDSNGNKLVDYIGKFENLQNDFTNICTRIGIEPVTLPVMNTSVHRHYKEYYDEYTRRVVGEVFKEDIELFDYEF